MISYVSEPSSGHLETKKVIPLLTPFAFPLLRGTYILSDPECRGIKPLLIKAHKKARQLFIADGLSII